jgi:hypothetical protein
VDTISWSGSTLLSDEFPPVCLWGEVAEARMSSLSIEKHFGVFADLSSRLLSGAVFPMIKHFLLECAEKPFQRGVVMAVPVAFFFLCNSCVIVSTNFTFGRNFCVIMPRKLHKEQESARIKTTTKIYI